MVQIEWLREVKNDLREIFNYISKDSKRYARYQIERIKNKTDILKTQPEIEKVVEELNNPEIRELIEGNYRIIYRNVTQERIDILMIHHAARDLTRRKI